MTFMVGNDHSSDMAQQTPTDELATNVRDALMGGEAEDALGQDVTMAYSDLVAHLNHVAEGDERGQDLDEDLMASAVEVCREVNQQTPNSVGAIMPLDDAKELLERAQAEDDEGDLDQGDGPRDMDAVEEGDRVRIVYESVYGSASADQVLEGEVYQRYGRSTLLVRDDEGQQHKLVGDGGVAVEVKKMDKYANFRRIGYPDEVTRLEAASGDEDEADGAQAISEVLERDPSEHYNDSTLSFTEKQRRALQAALENPGLTEDEVAEVADCTGRYVYDVAARADLGSERLRSEMDVPEWAQE